MIYQILTAYFDYKTMCFSDECTERLYDRMQKSLEMGNTRSLAFVYDKLEVLWFDDPDRPKPDITYLKGCLAFSSRAFEVLNSLFPKDAELIPFEIDGESWHFVNMMTPRDQDIDQISDEETLAHASYDESKNAVLTFKENRIYPELFYIEAANQKFFCQDKFKQAVESNNLKGLVFTQDLVLDDYSIKL